MGYLYKPRFKRKDGTEYECPVWWAKYYVDGRPFRRSTRTEKITKARAKLKTWEGDPRAALPHVDRVRFEDLTEDYLNDYRTNGKRTLNKAEDQAKRLRGWFGRRRAVNITTANVREYIAKRQAEGAANASINRELAALKRMFNLALQAEKLTRRPYIPMLEENNVRTGFFSEADYLALREALPSVLRPPVDFAYTYGWRKEEVFGLTWDRVDLAGGTVRLDPGTTKNAEGRTVVLTEGVRDTLTALRAQRPKDAPWVFHRNGKPIRDFRKTWQTACTAAGLGRVRDDGKWEGRLFHDLRRTAVRNMVRASIPERVAMMISGHRTRSIFDRYDIVSEGDLREAARKLDGATLAGTHTGTQAPLTVERVLSEGGVNG